MRKWQEMNALTLAYLGDAVYELWVRTHLLELGHEKVKELHKQAISYVRASTQAKLLHSILADLDEAEHQVVLRGRNAKGGHPKNVDVVTYRHATAFESLVGYWHLNGQIERMQWAFNKVDGMLQDDLRQKTDNSKIEIRKDEGGKDCDESGSDTIHT